MQKPPSYKFVLSIWVAVSTFIKCDTFDFSMTFTLSCHRSRTFVKLSNYDFSKPRKLQGYQMI